MIITRTPFRISLFGGGSDFPAWYKENGGMVLGFAINKYCYVSVRKLPPFFEHKHRIVYSVVESVKDAAEIKHPAVRAILQDAKIDAGLEIHHDGDLPARSGMGSSSAFTVGLLLALQARLGWITHKRKLADEAIRIEQNVIGENVGSQDQIWAAFGGMNCIYFQRGGEFNVQPLIIPPERKDALLDHLMLFFTGVSRFASDIEGDKLKQLDAKRDSMHNIAALAVEARNVLTTDKPLTELGMLLHEGWTLKKRLSDRVSTDMIDGVYAAARAAGALGGKLLGAGGGGFLLLFVEPERQTDVRNALAGLIEVEFGLDYEGSRVVVYEPNGLGSV